ncbi:ABC transporter permease subunit [Leptolyngbya ohadii]|uniref:ABC transporter permease subunit n=1 Tax=Leptolyngbya ohadii TaxID=1962290 RepID=UPI000B59A9D9|nr:ABC transporter permease subunit [Leptolyngbya ohadii]
MKTKALIRWRSIVMGLCCLLFILFTGTVNATAPRTLNVAIEPVYAPFEFTSASGELQGFDVDVIREIGKASGFNVNFQNLAFDGMIPALQSKTVDAAVGAMTITQQRAQSVDFSRPYFKAGLAIAVKEGTQGITQLEDLDGKRVAVQLGTTGAEAIKKVPGANVSTFNGSAVALQELSNGNVDAVVADAPIMLYALNTGNVQGLTLTGDLLTEEYYGIPTPKNSPNLQLINQGLGTILQNGTYERIYRKWFNAAPPQLPEVAPVLAAAQQGNAQQPARSIGWLATIVNAMPALLAGALITIILAAISVILGLVLGSLIAIARLSHTKPIRWAARAYIDFFRGTPLLVQLFMVYFGIPALLQGLGLQFSFDRFFAAVLALSLNAAAYMAEIVRGGIQSIETGQTEAAQSLGMDSTQTMRHIIFPQALRRMLPPLGNEFITLLKDTSLVAVIGFEELFRQGQLIVATTYRPFEIYAAVALIYLVLTLVSSQAFSYLEKAMNPVARRRAQRERADRDRIPAGAVRQR